MVEKIIGFDAETLVSKLIVNSTDEKEVLKKVKSLNKELLKARLELLSGSGIGYDGSITNVQLENSDIELTINDREHDPIKVQIGKYIKANLQHLPHIEITKYTQHYVND